MFSLGYRELHQQYEGVDAEFNRLVKQMVAFLSVAHNDDGTLILDTTGPTVTVRTLTFLFDNGASVLTVGTQTLPVSCPYAGTITAARLLSPQTGSIVLDVWKDTYATYPPTVADTITAAAKPTLSAANKADVTLTGWTTTVAAGDVFIAKVDSASGIRACSLQLTLAVP